MPGRLCPPRGRRSGLGIGRGGLSRLLGEDGLPAERERTAHQGPVPPDRPVAADLEVGPAELALDLLVALLDPVAQPIQAHHLGQVRLLAAAAGRPGQVGQQIPAAMPRQPGRVGGGHHQPQPPIRTPAAKLRIRGPPGLGMPIAEAAGNPPPPPWPAGAAPAELAGRLDRGVGRIRRRPGAFAGLEGQHEGETVLDGVGDGDQAAQHEDQAEDDGQVIGDPEPAVGDRAGDAFGVPDGGCWMEEVADQPQQGAGDARVRPDAQDPPCGCGGGGHHRSLAAGWSWLVRASRASSTSAASTASDSRLATATERPPRIGEAVSSRLGWPRAWGTALVPFAQVPYWSAGGSTMAWVTWRATNRTATSPTRTHGRSRSRRKSRTKIGYTDLFLGSR